MSRKGTKKPLSNRCQREEKAASPAADTRKIPIELLGSTGTEEAPTGQSLGRWDWLLAVTLVVVVFLAYQPAWQGGFIWDDDLHLLDNPVLKPGGLAKVWVAGGYKAYWPLTYTAYWLQSRFWGLEPTGFHVVNIAVHAISALLAWRILVQLRAPGAMFAAAIFALHPVNVESVAWIAQLKGLLSLLLALVSMLLFLAHERLGGWWRWALAIGAFGLSTLAKGMLITLPVVLLAYAWWQRGRIGRQDLLRVLPYLVIGAVMAVVNIWTQHLEGSNGADVRSDGFLSRAAVAGCAVWFYLWKLIWPLDLCFIYPRWRIDGRDVLFYLPGALLAIILGLAWWRRGAWGRPIVMLIVCYTALLLPSLGFVNILFMCYSLVADHWQYPAMIVPCAALAGAAATLDRRRVGRMPTGRVLGVALLAALAVLTWRHCRRYADREMLYRTTIERNPDCWMAHGNLGFCLAGRGQVDEAIAHFQRALEIKPDYVQAHNNLGNALAGRGQVDEAIVHFRKALEAEPDCAKAHYNLGNALAGRGQVDEAVAHYRMALEVNPDDANVNNNLGFILAGRGRLDEAIAYYRKAVEIQPDYAEAHNNLAAGLAGRGHLDEAVMHYKQALAIKPDFPSAEFNLGNALAGCGQVDEAIAHYRRALAIKPDYAEAHSNLGVALARHGEVDEAIAHFRTALEIKPDYADAHCNFALVLAGRGRVDEALAHYQTALGLAAARNDKAQAEVIRARIRLCRPVAPAGYAP
jgi:tetratricopeptide (TPR) repeat protein